MNPKRWQVWVLGAALMSCKGGDREASLRGDPAAARGATVAVRAASVTVAFSNGRLSANTALTAFSIWKHPVTVGQYRACVEAGLCGWSQATCANDEGADEEVAQCVGIEGARAFCGWTGGVLPSLAQWLLAVRGPTVRRYAWGDAPPTCDQHPLAVSTEATVETREAAALRASGSMCGVEGTGLLHAGAHPYGASPSGLQDVLLTQGELLRSDPANPFSVCASDDGACVVYGLTPGAIEAIQALSPGGTTRESIATVAHPYGFRCVSQEGA